MGVVSVSGPASSDVELSGVSILSRDNKVLFSTGVGDTAADGSHSLMLQPSAATAADWPSDLLLRVTGSAGAHKVAAVAPFFYDEPIGRITEVGAAHVDGVNLVIPVSADLEGPGYYAVSGNLYSTDGNPLVHLESKAQLSVFDNSTTLKAHRAALQAQGDAGPYLLKDLMLRKLPDKPGDRTLFGPSSKQIFKVQGFPFDRYAQDPYEDPLRKARLEFLRNAQPDLG